MRPVSLIAGCVVVCIAACAEEQAPRPKAAARPLAIVGYLPYYQLKSFDPAICESIDDLIYFSLQPTASGEIDGKDVTADALARLREIRTRHGTRIHIAVGGWGRGEAFGDVATSDERRGRFVAALLSYCQENKLDGVDFDWEFPDGKDEIAAYGVLLSQTKAALKPHGMSVTVAVAGWQELTAESIQAVDRVHLMSYDHEGPHHATLEQAQQDVERVLARGVPKEKLVLGLPCYGRNPSEKPHALPYASIVRKFHPDTESDTAGGYAFNGIRTVQQKTRYALDQGLGGIMMWELGQDTTDETSLARAIKSTLPKRDSGATE